LPEASVSVRMEEKAREQTTVTEAMAEQSSRKNERVTRFVPRHDAKPPYRHEDGDEDGVGIGALLPDDVVRKDTRGEGQLDVRHLQHHEHDSTGDAQDADEVAHTERLPHAHGGQ